MGWKSIAGILAGEGKDTVVLFDRDRGATKILKIRGHWLYVQKTVRPNAGAELIVEVCDKTASNHNMMLVLAVGEKCGEPIEPLDIVTCPDEYPLGKERLDSYYEKDTHFLREETAQMVIKREEHDNGGIAIHSQK